jgi:hypothetical protein
MNYEVMYLFLLGESLLHIVEHDDNVGCECHACDDRKLKKFENSKFN